MTARKPVLAYATTEAVYDWLSVAKQLTAILAPLFHNAYHCNSKLL